MPALRSLAAARPRVADWVATGAALDGAAWHAHFTAASRKVGRAPLSPSAAEQTLLAAAGVDWALPWEDDDLARVTLLVDAAGRLTPAALETRVAECYRHGDNRERQAVLRALPFLPDGARFVPLAVDACRTHVQPIFEAIACENAYPAAHFPADNFNQLALKAAFLGIALARVVHLASRRSPELARMADDYAAERRAAGRPVPSDLTLIGSRT
jgi:hypothetical protein